jgi:prophage regulatory protein
MIKGGPTSPGAPRRELFDMSQIQRFIRKSELPQFTGLKRTAIEDAVKAGTFPKPIRIGPRNVAWLESELADWQSQRIAQRDAS